MTAVYLGNELVNVLLPLREPIAYANGIRLEFVSEKFRKRSIEVIAVHSPAFSNLCAASTKPPDVIRVN